MYFDIEVAKDEKVVEGTYFDLDKAAGALNPKGKSGQTTFFLRYRKGARRYVQELQKLVCA